MKPTRITGSPSPLKSSPLHVVSSFILCYTLFDLNNPASPSCYFLHFVTERANPGTAAGVSASQAGVRHPGARERTTRLQHLARPPATELALGANPLDPALKSTAAATIAAVTSVAPTPTAAAATATTPVTVTTSSLSATTTANWQSRRTY
jgi:hypothetical protein